MTAYWDPLPTAQKSVEPTSPQNYLLGTWDERNWLNVPGPFYTAGTDTCWVGREVAQHHILYDDSHQEFVYRQPRTPREVRDVLSAAHSDPLSAYAWDGDQHWTVASVREWWRNRGRVHEWIDRQSAVRAASSRADEREVATGLADFRTYLDGELAQHLRGYLFWLSEHRVPPENERLPEL